MQPTDRRTFVQGLRFIEGVQDFFLIVLRDKDQPALNVDVFLQTGHFPENVDLPPPAAESVYEFADFTLHWEDSMNASDTWTFFGDGYKTAHRKQVFDVVDEANGWEADPTRGDGGKGGEGFAHPAASGFAEDAHFLLAFPAAFFHCGQAIQQSANAGGIRRYPAHRGADLITALACLAQFVAHVAVRFLAVLRGNEVVGSTTAQVAVVA